MSSFGLSPREERTRKKKLNRIARINNEIDEVADIPQNKVRLDALYAERERIGNRLGLLPVSYIWYGLVPTMDAVLV